MNLLGRLFIILIFIGSIGLASFSVVLYATHTNWKERSDKLALELKGKTQELSNLQKLKADMETALNLEIERRRTSIQALTEKVALLTEDCEKADEEKAELKKELAVQVAAVQASHETAESLRIRFDGVSKAYYDAQNDWVEMNTNLISKMDDLHALEIQITNYRATCAQLADDYRNVMEVLRINNLSPDPALYTSHPPAGISGTVTEIRPGGMVELSIGSDSGLVKGHQLDIVRNREGRSSYIGKVEITNTATDRAVAKVMPEFRRGIVQLGDEVTFIEVNILVAH
ncbi:MAG: hypothetical protein LBI05_01120 [Planctomycetaceae bacterium]|jgi:hypothetical protein|nr:hypothetical protein [Planctomycetaceae bacterium]